MTDKSLMERYISKHFATPDMHRLPVALKHGAYEMLERALKMEPDEVIELVKASGLRGHGVCARER